MGTVIDAATAVLALVAVGVSVAAFKQAGRSAEEALDQAREVAGDLTAGSFAMAYRDHVWSLWRDGLSVEEIEAILRSETIRPGVSLEQGNAYDGFFNDDEAHREGGLGLEIGHVADILDPLEKRREPNGGVTRLRPPV